MTARCRKKNRLKAMPADGMTAAPKMGIRHIPSTAFRLGYAVFAIRGTTTSSSGKERKVRRADGHLMPLHKDMLTPD